VITGFFQRLALHTFRERFAEFQNAAGQAPHRLEIGALLKQYAALIITNQRRGVSQQGLAGTNARTQPGNVIGQNRAPCQMKSEE
jgi:hypothetical protein